MSPFQQRTRSSSGTARSPKPSSSASVSNGAAEATLPDSDAKSSQRTKLSFSDIASMFVRLRRFSLRAGVQPKERGTADGDVAVEEPTKAPTTPTRQRTRSSGNASASATPMSSPSTFRSQRKVRKLSTGPYTASPKPLKAKPHHIICKSSDAPLTHSNLDNSLEEGYEGRDLYCLDAYECYGAVDVKRLLRITRSSIIKNLRSTSGFDSANVLTDEQWISTICGPKNKVYRVQIEYFATATRSSKSDPGRPVALEQAQGIPGVMSIIRRNDGC